MWCLIVKCHFINGLYIQTSLDVNCLPATSDCYYHTYVQKWWSGKKKKKKKIFLYFHIREVLSHSWESGCISGRLPDNLGGFTCTHKSKQVSCLIDRFMTSEGSYTLILPFTSKMDQSVVKQTKDFLIGFY